MGNGKSTSSSNPKREVCFGDSKRCAFCSGGNPNCFYAVVHSGVLFSFQVCRTCYLSNLSDKKFPSKKAKSLIWDFL